MSTAPVLPRAVSPVAEVPDGAGLYVHPGWATELPWVVQGITSGSDMSLFGAAPSGQVIARWLQLRDRLLCSSMVHARQVHEADLLVHEDVAPGLLLGPDADGHLTRQDGVLLGVSVADCVPVFLAATDARAVALLHAGWRGAAAGILEEGIRALRDRFGAVIADLYVHFGPAICGECYEVGPEVPAGLRLQERHASHVDLRAALAGRAVDFGVEPARVTTSSFCTRHGDSPFFSHRAGCRERQLAVLGVRTA